MLKHKRNTQMIWQEEESEPSYQMTPLSPRREHIPLTHTLSTVTVWGETLHTGAQLPLRVIVMCVQLNVADFTKRHFYAPWR